MDVFHVKDRVGVAGSETRVSEGGQSYDNNYDIAISECGQSCDNDYDIDDEDDAISWWFQMMIALVAPVLLLIYPHVASTTGCTH